MTATLDNSNTSGQPRGPALRDLRIGAGISQSDIAHDAGISESHLSRFEHGQRDVSTTTYYRIVASIASRSRR